MKKIILSIIAVLGLGFANAQETAGEGFSNGDAFISGSFNLGSNKYSAQGNFKESTFSIAPTVGFFVSQNIALGLGLGFSSSKITKEEGDDAFKTTTTTIGAYGRYYFTPAAKFSVFGQLSVEYATTKFNPSDLKVNGFGLGLSPGVNYFLNRNFAIEASWGALNYASAKADVDGAEASNDFEFGLNLDNINFGIIYKF